MTIKEMHNEFRIVGQQMGMQTIRGILPETIDVYLNSAIIDKTKEALLQGIVNVNSYNVIENIGTMYNINLFTRLYKSLDVKLRYEDLEDPNNNTVYNSTIGKYTVTIRTDKKEAINMLAINHSMFLGFDVKYDDDKIVNCRIVNRDVLYRINDDYCNKPSKEHPVVCIISSIDTQDDDDYEDINYFGKPIVEIYTNNTKSKITYLNCQYLKKPNTVKYSTTDSECVDCDLADYAHHEIVELAVNKFRQSIYIEPITRPQSIKIEK